MAKINHTHRIFEMEEELVEEPVCRDSDNEVEIECVCESDETDVQLPPKKRIKL